MHPFFKLVSSQPYHQPKKKGIVTDFKLVVSNISYYFYMTMAISLKDTRMQLCVKGWLQKFNITNMKTVTWLGFFSIEEFYQSCNFGCIWWILLLLSLYVEHIKIFVWPSRICLRISPQFVNIMKKLCTRAMNKVIIFFQNCWLNVMIFDSRPKKGWNIFKSLKSW